MNGNEVLTRNIDKIHTTEMGIEDVYKRQELFRRLHRDS